MHVQCKEVLFVGTRCSLWGKYHFQNGYHATLLKFFWKPKNLFIIIHVFLAVLHRTRVTKFFDITCKWVHKNLCQCILLCERFIAYGMKLMCILLCGLACKTVLLSMCMYMRNLVCSVVYVCVPIVCACMHVLLRLFHVW